MGKTIISLPFLGGENFISVAFEHADRLMKEKKLDKEKISKELNEAGNEQIFAVTYNKYFGDEIKLLL